MSDKTKRISDLTLSAYLKTVGHPLVGIEGDGYKAYFIFAATPELERDTLKYFNSQAVVDPLRFGELLRDLKGLAVSNRS